MRDVLLIGPWHHEHDRSHTHRRAPTDYDADHVLLRMIRCVNGEIQVTMDCDPRFDYARKRGQLGVRRRRATTRRSAAPTDCDVELRLTSDMNMGFEGPRATARTLMQEGDKVFVALSWSEHPAPHDERRGVRAGSSGPRTTGSTGSTTGPSPTTPGAPTSSARR